MKTKPSYESKEYQYIEREEERRLKLAYKKPEKNYKDKIESKIPEKIYLNMQKAFTKAFEIVFERGDAILEKTYNKDDLLKDYEISDYAIHKKGGRKEYKNLHSQSKTSRRVNMLLSTVEGSLLGVLGIGLPDIVLFTGMLLKGAYETSLHYGYDYDTDAERYFILLLMEASLAKEDHYMEANQKVNDMITENNIYEPTKEQISEQLKKTSETMATDMLIMKFIQGLPIVGIMGGIMNPVYYRKINGYMQLKYRMRYLQDKNKNDNKNINN